MKLSKSIKISRNQLLANKLRTFFALMGIIIGVSAVIVMVAIGNGARNEVLGKIEEMGTNLIIVNAGQVQKNVGRQQIRGTVTSLTLKDVDILASECPDVRMAAPVQTKNAGKMGKRKYAYHDYRNHSELSVYQKFSG